MARRSRYQGAWLQIVDDKNRVSIPAKLRETVEANTAAEDLRAGHNVTIAIHRQSQCLIGYDQGYLDDELDRAARIEDSRIDADGHPDYAIRRTLAGGGDQVAFDSTGRCVLAGWQRRKAKIGKHAFFWGSIDCFEIWDPQVLFADPAVPDVMKDACRGLMEDRGLAQDGGLL
ncbi:division/cell wall cluster transcriptional repressor MraZ [uncultured Sphingomonas sp.]|uniref:division/cell wall cluster transcriptional repressor MraZ n=1 Tax=uncultured Sphingomonas sp. TaxID=158754 RepID=UPI0035CBF135